MNEMIFRLAESLNQALLAHDLRITTAESCTGGAVSSALTSVSGSSRWFDVGYVTYSNEAKHKLLAVELEILEREGAVSEAVAKQMLLGAITASGADLGIAITGIAGPDGGSQKKPVGTVCIAWGSSNSPQVTTFLFSGQREDVRRSAVSQSLALVQRFIRENYSHI